MSLVLGGRRHRPLQLDSGGCGFHCPLTLPAVDLKLVLNVWYFYCIRQWSLIATIQQKN